MFQTRSVDILFPKGPGSWWFDVVNFSRMYLLKHGYTVEGEDDGGEDEVGEENDEDEDHGGALSEGPAAGEDMESVS